MLKDVFLFIIIAVFGSSAVICMEAGHSRGPFDSNAALDFCAGLAIQDKRPLLCICDGNIYAYVAPKVVAPSDGIKPHELKQIILYRSPEEVLRLTSH